MKIMSVAGARPQFIKLAPVSRALRLRHTEVIVHTGQHYDAAMSEVFLRELQIPAPDYQLESGSGTHAEQTAKMLVGIEAAITDSRPEVVLVFGDTNSTLAGALAAAKLDVRVAHVEAGLRSFVRSMPEEINRVVTDHLSHWLFCPTEQSVRNLAAEGIVERVSVVGDVMLDAARQFGPGATLTSPALAPLKLAPHSYILATIHRAATTDDPQRLSEVVQAFAQIDEPIVFPVHPRTRAALRKAALHLPINVRAIDPAGYLDMLALARHARMVMTDSGGVQKEAYFFGVPCLTLRTETEWTELVDAGWNRLVGTDGKAIADAVRTWRPSGARPALYGSADAATRIAETFGAA